MDDKTKIKILEKQLDNANAKIDAYNQLDSNWGLSFNDAITGELETFLEYKSLWATINDEDKDVESWVKEWKTTNNIDDDEELDYDPSDYED